MALNDQQKADVRRFMGYPAIADTPVDDVRDFAYAFVTPGVYTTLFHRLNNLSSSEEGVLVNTYLTPLYDLELAITTASDNLDTDQAAVWTRNKTEIGDRMSLFDNWRVRLCSFLGFPPGPFLSTGARVVRC